jgi:hypothetical protein
MLAIIMQAFLIFVKCKIYKYLQKHPRGPMLRSALGCLLRRRKKGGCQFRLLRREMDGGNNHIPPLDKIQYFIVICKCLGVNYGHAPRQFGLPISIRENSCLRLARAWRSSREIGPVQE